MHKKNNQLSDANCDASLHRAWCRQVYDEGKVWGAATLLGMLGTLLYAGPQVGPAGVVAGGLGPGILALLFAR